MTHTQHMAPSTPLATGLREACEAVAALEVAKGATWLAWRHPKPRNAAGLCLGARTDAPVDPRKARRLAHRIRQMARRHGWPRMVYTSPLQRCMQVGRQLKRWGWQHRIDPALAEIDFGDWDGLPWSAIPKAEVDRWCDDFLHARPGLGSGESLAMMFERVAIALAGIGQRQARPDTQGAPCLIVTHGGWIQVAQWLSSGNAWPTHAAQWSAAPAYGSCRGNAPAQ